MVKIVETKADFDKELEAAGDKAILVDFYADWCGPCKQIAPHLEEQAAVYTSIVFLKVNVDDNEEVAAEYSISAMPTFLIIKNKAKVDELVGANKDKLDALMEKYK